MILQLKVNSRATDNTNVERTKNVIAQLSQKYSDPQYYGVVTALALLNGKLKLCLFNADRTRRTGHLS